jgi:hypothetical protein
MKIVVARNYYEDGVRISRPRNKCHRTPIHIYGTITAITER